MDIGKIFKDSAQVTVSWLKSHLIMAGIVFAMLMAGLLIINYCIVDFGNPAGIFFIALGLALFDMLPALGLLLPMTVWGGCAIVFAGNTALGISVIVLCFIVMILRQIIEPFAVGRSMGISAFEEIGSSLAGFILTGFHIAGLILGPLIYTIVKTIYINHHSAPDDKTSRDE